jgi:hypothetical protein
MKNSITTPLIICKIAIILVFKQRVNNNLAKIFSVGNKFVTIGNKFVTIQTRKATPAVG